MPFFLSKLKEISTGNYPTEFLMEVQGRHYLYELSGLLNTGQFDAAVHLTETYTDFFAKKATMTRPETQLKLSLYSSILYLCLGEPMKARKSMKNILGSGKFFHTLPSLQNSPPHQSPYPGRTRELLLFRERNKLHQANDRLREASVYHRKTTIPLPNGPSIAHL